MSYSIFPVPLEQWQAETMKLSRNGLLSMIDELTSNLLFPLDSGKGYLLPVARRAKAYGRYLDAMARHEKFAADPDGFVIRSLQRKANAKKAARKRKKARRL